MPAATYDLTIEQGATFVRTIRVTEDDLPKNITGYEVRSQLRRKVTATTTLAEFTCTITNAAQGEFTLALTATETADLPFGAAVYDIELEIGGVVTRLVSGDVLITPEVTR